MKAFLFKPCIHVISLGFISRMSLGVTVYGLDMIIWLPLCCTKVVGVASALASFPSSCCCSGCCCSGCCCCSCCCWCCSDCCSSCCFFCCCFFCCCFCCSGCCCCCCFCCCSCCCFYCLYCRTISSLESSHSENSAPLWKFEQDQLVDLAVPLFFCKLPLQRLFPLRNWGGGCLCIVKH